MSWLKSLFARPPVPVQTVHDHAYQNFTYVKQPKEWDVTGRIYSIHNVKKAFTGDCDDFAASVAVALQAFGARYVEFYRWDGVKHAACVCSGWVSDCNRMYPYKEKELKNIVLDVDANHIARHGKRV